MRITNMLLRDIMRSYNLQAYQMVDWPAWLSTKRFDIVAKAEGHPSNAERMPMVRALLADLFKLVVHTETREQPTYSLVLANRDRSLGPKLVTSSADCAALRNALPATGPRQTLDGLRVDVPPIRINRRGRTDNLAVMDTVRGLDEEAERNVLTEVAHTGLDVGRTRAADRRLV